MAIDETKQTKSAGMKGRRWLFGTNVAIMVIIALALLVVVNWLGQKTDVSRDVSAAGVNSLSERTKQMLAKVDEPIWLTSFYTVTDVSKGEQKYLDRVTSLFKLYQRANSKVETKNVKLTDKATLDGVLENLRKKYAAESEKPRKIIDAALPLAEKLVKSLTDDSNKFMERLEKDPALAVDRDAQTVAFSILPTLTQSLTDLSEDVKALTDPEQTEIPRYDKAVEKIKAEFNQVKTLLTDPQKGVANWLRSAASRGAVVRQPARRTGPTTAPAGDRVELQKETITFFEQMAARCESLSKDVQTSLADMDKIGDQELSSLAQPQKWPRAVLVETQKRAKLVSFNDLWQRRDENMFAPDSPDETDSPEKKYIFRGEAAVSSAILQLTQQEKTAVVFVRYGGESPIQMGWSPRGPSRPEYAAADKRLKESNFVVLDWDVATNPTPPSPPSDEKVNRTIYIVLRPSAPQPPNPQMRMMQPPKRFSPEDAKKVMDVLGDSSRLLILAGWVQPEQQQMMMMGMPPQAEYEWQELVRKWGVTVDEHKPILRSVPVPDTNPQRWAPASQSMGTPFLLDSPRSLVFEKHPIADAIAGHRLGLKESAPLTIVNPAPQGVQVTPIIKTEDTGDIWALADLQRTANESREEGTYLKHSDDVPAPLTVAVASTNDKGGKAVIVSSFDFATDMFSRVQIIGMAGGNMQLGVPYPGNLELLLNSIFWLNDNENQIAAGPNVGNVRTIGRITPGKLTAWRWTVWAIWPALALVAGTVVWFIRRK